MKQFGKKIIYLLCISFFPLFLPGCAGFNSSQTETTHATHQDILASQAELMRLLASDNRQARERAALSLLSTGDGNALQVIIDKLEGPSGPEIKVDILNILNFRTDRRVFENVLNAISDPHPDVKAAAARALSGYSRPEEIQAIIEYSSGPHITSGDKKLLYATFGDGVFVSATPLLIDGLGSDDPSLKDAAWVALRRIWDRNLPPEREPWQRLWDINRYRSRAQILEERLRAAEVNLKAQNQKIQHLETELAEFYDIAISDHKKNPLILVEALSSPNRRLVDYAAFRLNRMSAEDLRALSLDDNSIYNHISAGLRKTPLPVARQVAELISRLDGQYRENLIHDAFEFDQPEVIVPAINAVGPEPGVRVVEKLKGFLLHPDPLVRSSAANVLSKSSEPGTVAALRNSLKDEDANVRWFAVESLRKLEAASSFPDLVRLLETDSSPLVREITASTLGQWAQPGAFPALRKAIFDESRRVREQAARSLAALVENSPDRVLVVGEALVAGGMTAEARRLIDSTVKREGEGITSEIQEQVDALKLQIADKLRDQENYSDAASLYREVINSAGFTAEVAVRLINTYLDGGEYDRAFEQISEWFMNEETRHRDDLIRVGIDLLNVFIEINLDEQAAKTLELLLRETSEISPPPECNILQELETIQKELLSDG